MSRALFPALRWTAALLAVAVLTSCDSSLQEPGEGGPASVAVAASVATSHAGDAGLVAAFEAADGLDVRLTRAEDGSVLAERSLAFDASGGDVTEATLEVELEEDRVDALLELSLLAGTEVLFTGQGSLTLEQGEEATVEVPMEPIADRLELRDEPLTFTALDDSVGLHATMLFATGDTLGGVQPAWSSDDPAVAEVLVDGTVVSRGSGQTQVRASYTGASDSVPVTVSADPDISISSPGDGASFGEGREILFQGSATDPQDGTLTGTSLVWESDVDGHIGTGTDTTSSSLSIASHTIRLIATDSDGNADTASVGISVEGVPAASITSPAGGSTFSETDTVALVGSATDEEDGELTGSALVWSSDLDGQLATGDSTEASGLSPGDHVLSLTATDSDGFADTASVSISVTGAPSVSISSPADSAVVNEDDAVTFTGSASDQEDGSLTGTDLVWASDVDGTFGTGDTLTVSRIADTLLADTTHRVTLTATDSDGNEGSASIELVVEADGSISGSVFRTNDGAAFDSVPIVLAPTEDTTATHDTTLSAADGSYTFSEVDPAQYSISLTDVPERRFATSESIVGYVATLGSGEALTQIDFSLQMPEVTYRADLSTDSAAVGDTVGVTVSVAITDSLPEPLATSTGSGEWNASIATLDSASVAAPDWDSFSWSHIFDSFTGTETVDFSTIDDAGLVGTQVTLLVYDVVVLSSGITEVHPGLAELETVNPDTGELTSLMDLLIFHEFFDTLSVP